MISNGLIKIDRMKLFFPSYQQLDAMITKYYGCNYDVQQLREK